MKVTVCKKQMPKYETTCQLHGEPIYHDAYTQISYILPSGKVKQLQLMENITNVQIVEILQSHPINLKNCDFEFKDWDEVFPSDWFKKSKLLTSDTKK